MTSMASSELVWRLGSSGYVMPRVRATEAPLISFSRKEKQALVLDHYLSDFHSLCTSLYSWQSTHLRKSCLQRCHLCALRRSVRYMLHVTLTYSSADFSLCLWRILCVTHPPSLYLLSFLVSSPGPTKWACRVVQTRSAWAVVLKPILRHLRFFDIFKERKWWGPSSMNMQ